MKNLLPFILLIIIISLIFVGKTVYDAPDTETTFSTVFKFNGSFTSQLVENYFSDDSELKKKSEEKIKTFVLKDLGYDNWLEYADYVELVILPMDINDSTSEELVMALNLSKDEGVIGIYKLNDDKDQYMYENKIVDLSYVKKVMPIENAEKGRWFIVVNEFLDESFGAYFVDDYIRIFTLLDDTYKEVYRQSKDYEAYYYEKWSDPSIEEPRWFKLTEKSIIDFMTGDDKKVIINLSKNIKKYESPATEDESIPEEFTLVTDKDFNITSLWNENFKYFIQGVGKVKSDNEVVGIIASSEETADSLLNSPDKYYQVIYKDGTVNYVKEADLIILNDYSSDD